MSEWWTEEIRRVVDRKREYLLIGQQTWEKKVMKKYCRKGG